MKTMLITALATGMALAAVAPANARQGCSPGYHRGPQGHCRPNGRGPVVRGSPVAGSFYAGRGYWDGHRYWQHRYRHNGGWRYR